MTESAAIADTLEKAAEHIRAGWTQDRLFEEVDGQQHCCASGAIWLACGLSKTEQGKQIGRTPEHDLWYETYCMLGKFVGDDVPSWNDSIARTQNQVVETMLHLAKELRNESS